MRTFAPLVRILRRRVWLKSLAGILWLGTTQVVWSQQMPPSQTPSAPATATPQRNSLRNFLANCFRKPAPKTRVEDCQPLNGLPSPFPDQPLMPGEPQPILPETANPSPTVPSPFPIMDPSAPVASETTNAATSPSTVDFESPMASAGLSRNTSIPMLGDKNGGGCGGLFIGGLQRVTLAHPTFGCTRLNIAENGSPIPQDRVYVRYNHYNNATATDIFSDNGGSANSLNIDQVTLGLEKTFCDGRASIEARVPFARQLTSNIFLQDYEGTYTNIPLDDYSTELNNISLIFKYLFLDRPNFRMSAGLGLNIPTGKDVNLGFRIQNSNFNVAGPGQPPDLQPVYADFAGVVRNQTFNLSPFVGFVQNPSSRSFVQGFAQFDLPLNPSEASVRGETGIFVAPDQAIIFNSYPQTEGQVRQQTLMRLNIGAGYWAYHNPDSRFITGVIPMIELHYLTALCNATLLEQQFPIDTFAIDPVNLKVGNLANRIDVLNLVLGNTLEFGNRATLGTGFVIPLRNGTGDKPFDYEVNAYFNYRF